MLLYTYSEKIGSNFNKLIEYFTFYTVQNSTSVVGKVARGEVLAFGTTPIVKFMCHVKIYDISIATGLFIAKKFVLTTADILFIEKKERIIDNVLQDRELIDVNKLKVYVRRLADSFFVDVKKIHINNNYVLGSHIHDIAILRVSYFMRSKINSSN